jgi:malate dehydrogenase (quinone)
MFAAREDCGLESSQGWNSAGAGHAANCEQSYTPQREDGSADISEALEVNTEFDFVASAAVYLIHKGAIPDRGVSFITSRRS